MLKQSLYGTEQVFTDGDDTPWSKGFLASCYASRGLKMRFTSGTGSEVQMGYAEGKSMLYLETRCIFLTKPPEFKVCKMVQLVVLVFQERFLQEFVQF